MEEARNLAKRLALRAFAAAGRSEEEIGEIPTGTTVPGDLGCRVGNPYGRSQDSRIHGQSQLLRLGFKI
jgi:hypothetical protein